MDYDRPYGSVVARDQLTSNIDLIVDRRIDSVFLGAGFPADTSPVDSQEAAMVRLDKTFFDKSKT